MRNPVGILRKVHGKCEDFMVAPFAFADVLTLLKHQRVFHPL